jgi:HIV Tat-specific factor 1
MFEANIWQLMNGRWFDERQLEAFIATGNEKFKKSNDKSTGLDEEDEEEAEEGGRLDKFGSWLEQEK